MAQPRPAQSPAPDEDAAMPPAPATAESRKRARTVGAAPDANARSQRNKAAVTAVLGRPAYRVRSYSDPNIQESKSVLFARDRPGAVAKLIVDRPRATQAHVKSIFVKEGFRGKRFSHLLFLSELRRLRREQSPVAELLLEAEEDAARHGRLVGLYNSWGFRPREGASVSFLYNQDQTLRRVPMGRGLASPPPPTAEALDNPRLAADLQMTAADGDEAALAVLQFSGTDLSLVTPELGFASVSGAAASDVLLVADAAGEHLVLVSAHGRELGVTAEGAVAVVEGRGSEWTVEDLSDDEFALRLRDGRYLDFDPVSWRAVAGPAPRAIRVGEVAAHTCASDMELFAQLKKRLNTEAFAERMAQRWARASGGGLGLWAALQRLPEGVDASRPSAQHALPQLADVVSQAEALRAAGHPDWLQLVAVLLGAGLVLARFGSAREGLGIDAASQWALTGDTWSLRAAGSAGALADDHVVAFTNTEYVFRRVRALGDACSLPLEALLALRFRHCPTFDALAFSEAEAAVKDVVAHIIGVLEGSHSPSYSAEVPAPTLPPDAPLAELREYYEGLAEKYVPGLVF